LLPFASALGFVDGRSAVSWSFDGIHEPIRGITYLTHIVSEVGSKIGLAF
jgi:hypothetical protein